MISVSHARFFALTLLLGLALALGLAHSVRADGSEGTCEFPTGERPTGVALAAAKEKEGFARRHGRQPDQPETESNVPDAISAILFTSFQQQQNSYYCGPASAWMVNQWVGPHFWGHTTSYLGESLTQGNLAQSAYLNTTTDGTAFSSNWRRALNKWWNGSESGWYLLSWGPSLANFKNDLTFDIDSNYPLVMDVHISGQTCYLAGYPAGTDLYHYVMAHGYDQYGARTYYSDPWDSGFGSLGDHWVDSAGVIRASASGE